VILSDDTCMQDAESGAGTWNPDPPFGSGPGQSYYANQCYADPYLQGDPKTFQTLAMDGIKQQVASAAETRAYQGGGDDFDPGDPEKPGPPMQGGLWTLFVQATPTIACLRALKDFDRAEQDKVLTALYQDWWPTFPAVHANVNILSGDFAQEGDLVKDVLAMDETYPEVPGAITRRPAWSGPTARVIASDRSPASGRMGSRATGIRKAAAGRSAAREPTDWSEVTAQTPMNLTVRAVFVTDSPRLSLSECFCDRAGGRRAIATTTGESQVRRTPAGRTLCHLRLYDRHNSPARASIATPASSDLGPTFRSVNNARKLSCLLFARSVVVGVPPEIPVVESKQGWCPVRPTGSDGGRAALLNHA
jgi:hypothetical protein